MDVLERIAELQKIIEERTGLSRVYIAVNIHHNNNIHIDDKIGRTRAKSAMKKLLGEEAQCWVQVGGSKDMSAEWVTYSKNTEGNYVDITVFHA